MKYLVLVPLILFSLATAAFESNGALDQWDLLDYKGDARMERATADDCPPGYGPEVLRLSGTVAILLGKDSHLRDGTYVALYRERAAATEDADGVILFGGAFGDDLSLEHNTKTMRPHLWLEQDNDTGLSFRFAPAEGEDHAVAEAVAVGLVTDPWNKTGWIWQKVQLTGGNARAKFWPAHEAEPAEWALESAIELPGGRFGLRINSGDIEVAWFAASTDDIPIAAPENYLHLLRTAIPAGEALPLALYTQRDRPVDQVLRYTIAIEGGRTIAHGTVNASLPGGAGELRLAVAAPGDNVPESVLVLPLDATLPLGRYSLQLVVGDSPPVEVSFRVEAASDVLATLHAREVLLDALDVRSETPLAVLEILRVARALLDRARALELDGQREESASTLRYVDETLAELHGVAGIALRESGTPIDWDAVPKGDETASNAPKEGLADYYRTDSALHFGAVESSAASFIMGHAYTVRIPFTLTGTSPTTDFTIQVALRDPLGIRTVAEASITPDPPTSQWRPGETYWQTVELAIPRDDTVKKVSQPVVLDEAHDLLVSVQDPNTGAHVLLDNAPGPQPGRIGHTYAAGRFYVSSVPLEITALDLELGPNGDTINATLKNCGNGRTAQARVRYLAPSGEAVFEQVYALDLDAGALVTIHAPVSGQHRGKMTAELTLWDGPGLLTEATQTADFPQSLSFVRENHVVLGAEGLRTPIQLRTDAPGPFDVTVETAGQVLANFPGLASGATFQPPPHFGYYDLTATSRDTTWHARIVATVVETQNGQLLVNGEPFIVKGVNVHGMDSHSPARTRLMMDMLKALGFNSLRGDYPARWQIDLAQEAGLTYDVLAPFSVSSTADIFARQDGPPLATARTLTRQFIARYQDAAAALLWNSCNEITDENIAFLLAQHPLYHLYDPYQRPVHYANLYGQDLWQGQDVMGVNYYFSDTQRAADRHPLIKRSAAIAREHGLPMLFTEFNSYHGAVPTTGVEAMEDLFTWGVETAGMAGGYLYMMPDSDRHPGVFDNGYNTHRIMDDAFHRAFDDAEVVALGLRPAANGEQGITLEIRNKRPYTLRNLVLSVTISGSSVADTAIADLKPGVTSQVRLPIPESASGPGYTVKGALALDTHHGIWNKIPVMLLIGR